MQASGINNYDKLRCTYNSHANAENPYNRWKKSLKDFKLNTGFQIPHFPLEKLLPSAVSFNLLPSAVTFNYPKHATFVS